MRHAYGTLARAVREKLLHSDSPERFGFAEDKWRMLQVLHAREMLAKETRLRDLHRLLDMPQHSAFRLARGLEVARMITIGVSLHDALDSELRVSEQGYALMIEAAQASNSR